jgi:hypothetical protein
MIDRGAFPLVPGDMVGFFRRMNGCSMSDILDTMDALLKEKNFYPNFNTYRSQLDSAGIAVPRMEVAMSAVMAKGASRQTNTTWDDFKRAQDFKLKTLPPPQQDDIKAYWAAGPTPGLPGANVPVAGPAAPALDVSAMSTTAKIEESLRRSIPLIPKEARNLVLAMISPESLETMAGTLVVMGVAQFFGVGEVADLVILLAGAVILGKTAVDAAQELIDYATGVVAARSPADLDTAAQHFAKAVMLVGVATVSALLLHKAGAARAARGAVAEEGTGAAAATRETPYARATKGLDLNVIKKLVVDAWKEPRKWPVKVFKLRPGQRIGDAVQVEGYITTEQSVAGASLRELERRLGFAPGYLGDGAAVVRLDRLPNSSEFDVRFYNNIDGGGVKPPNPDWPRGPGYPQWELLQKIPARIVQLVK